MCHVDPRGESRHREKLLKWEHICVLEKQYTGQCGWSPMIIGKSVVANGVGEIVGGRITDRLWILSKYLGKSSKGSGIGTTEGMGR